MFVNKLLGVIRNMKNIKLFKHISTNTFSEFVISYGYNLADVVGYSLVDKEQYHGNKLITYAIYFNDDEYEYFKVVYFKDFNEYKQTFLGFNGNKLLEWYENANLIWYKWKNEFIRVKYH